MQTIQIDKYLVGPNQPLAFICGPCVIEGEKEALTAAEMIKESFSNFPFQLIYKSSYDKANRSSIHSYRGPGITKGLKILQKIKEELDLPILTDIHAPHEAKQAAEICDILQIPAFLCRQTDLLVAAGETQKPINIKKGQFVAPLDMQYAVGKVLSTGNKNILLTDRGVCFGYNNLVSDMRAIPIMQSLGFPVCFDASHSTQMPGGSDQSGGQSQYIPVLAKAAVASGCNALFIEAHINPSLAKSDKNAMLKISDLPKLLEELQRLYDAVHPKALV